MKNLFVITLMLVFSLCSYGQNKKVPVKNQYYVVKERIEKLTKEIAEIEKQKNKIYDTDYSLGVGLYYELNQTTTKAYNHPDSLATKTRILENYRLNKIEYDKLSEKKNILYDQLGDLEYKFATMDNPEGHWKTYYKGNKKLTVWVENGKEYQYPPKK